MLAGELPERFRLAVGQVEQVAAGIITPLREPGAGPR